MSVVNLNNNARYAKLHQTTLHPIESQTLKKQALLQFIYKIG